YLLGGAAHHAAPGPREGLLLASGAGREQDGRELLRRDGRDLRRCRSSTHYDLGEGERLDADRRTRRIAKAIEGRIARDQAANEVGRLVRRQQAHLPAYEGRREAHGEAVAVRAAIEHVAPLRQGSGEAAHVAAELVDADGAPCVPGEYRAGAVALEQRQGGGHRARVVTSANALRMRPMETRGTSGKHSAR